MNTKICACCGRKFTSEAEYLHKTSQWRICDDGHLYFSCSCKSTLVIRKGMFDWFSPEKAMSIQAAAIFNKFSNKNTTPYIPSIVFEIQKQFEDSNCSVSEVTKSIKKDPVLSLNLMRIANLRNLGKDVITKLDHALSAIGLKRTGEFLLLIALGGFKFHSKIYTKSKLWEVSLVAGMIAEKVATDLNLDHDIPAASRWGKSPATLNDVVIFSNQLSHWIRLDPCRIDKKVLNESSKLLGLDESQLLKFANSCMPFRVLAQEQLREM